MLRMVSCLLALMMLLGCVFPAAAETAAPLGDDVLFSYYDGAVFVGDSITRQLRIYLKEQSAKDVPLPTPTFLTAQSYLLYTASRKNLLAGHTNISYRGSEQPLCRIIGQMDPPPPQVYILLGVNDYAGEDIPKHIGYCQRLVMLLKEFSPETKITFFSLTPVTKKFSGSKDRRALWDAYNLELEKLCAQEEVEYLDIATPLKDDDGYLKKEYCSDGQYHLSPEGLQVWLNTLKDHAQHQYENGQWLPGEEHQ